MYKLFIADDEAIIREGLRCLLDWETLGFTIAGEAANGDAALQFLLSETPDLVLLDIRMPGMSGLDVVRIAREHGYDGKVVILSGYSDFNYARTAIRYGVLSYLTKPIDEDELLEIVSQIRNQLDSDASARDSSAHYRQKAYDSIIRDLLAGTAAYDRLDRAELHLNADIYQVIIYEKYSHRTEDAAYRFSDLLRVTNQDHNSFDHITDDTREIILLKGSFATEKFNSFLERFQRQCQPQKDSPLDSLFLAYGRPVSHLEEIALSYTDASRLIDQRFFCEEDQHTLGYENLPTLGSGLPLITGAFLDEYAGRLFDGLSSFSRSRTAELLGELQTKLYQSSDSIDTIKLFFADLYLQIKERIGRSYTSVDIPFPGNGEIIRIISEKYYLYEIIRFLTEQFELILSSIGRTSKEGVIDDILYYIEHNYARNLTLEAIAPLFGYNSSYLRKIFSKKVGENFNSYLDHVRIEHSKELLLGNDMKVYEIAEKVGYRNVDYFHIKFKRQVGMTPAEFRRTHRQ